MTQRKSVAHIGHHYALKQAIYKMWAMSSSFISVGKVELLPMTLLVCLHPVCLSFYPHKFRFNYAF
jgi:hypothetical protein